MISIWINVHNQNSVFSKTHALNIWLRISSDRWVTTVNDFLISFNWIQVIFLSLNCDDSMHVPSIFIHNGIKINLFTGVSVFLTLSCSWMNVMSTRSKCHQENHTMDEPHIGLWSGILRKVPMVQNFNHAVWRFQKECQRRRSVRFIGHTLNSNCAIWNAEFIVFSKIIRLA